MGIDALVTAAQELGRPTEVPTPTIDAVLGLVQLRGFKGGAYGLAFQESDRRAVGSGSRCACPE
ncbi:hypothetical protein [Thalassobaculum sp.]|uniref:hypothetical protein n=1 Tax=Thalassobaculum sp. TaxID=2022740 RepID=UPI0032EC9BF4